MTELRVSYTLDSTLETVDSAEQTASRIAAESGFDEDVVMQISMAVREAAVNAVLHGNDYDPLIRRALAEGIDKTWANEVDSWTQCSTTENSSRGGDPNDQTVLRSQWKPSDTDDGFVCPWYWASPIHQLTCDWVWPAQYDQPPYSEPQGPLLELDEDWYSGKITEELVVEKLLTMAGLRLASILNLIFGQQHNQ